MSHHEEEAPKNESHKQEEHEKTSSPYELNSNETREIWLLKCNFKGRIMKNECVPWKYIYVLPENGVL